MRHSGDVDAFVWDEPAGRPDGASADGSPAVERSSAPPAPGASRRRMVAVGALIAVVLVGMNLTHDDGSGLAPDLLYAAAIHLGLIALLPRVDTIVHGAAVLVWCTGIELLQIIGLPEILAPQFPLCRLMLGTAFDPFDLPTYAIGVVAVLATDRVLSSRGSLGGAA